MKHYQKLQHKKITFEEIKIKFPEIKWNYEKNFVVENIENDSRAIKENSLFIAIKGEKVDGKNYILKAISNGAIAILSEDYVETNGVPIGIIDNSQKYIAKLSSLLWGNPSENMIMIAITGTNGKTTTAFLIKEILKNCGEKVGFIGTIGYEYDKYFFKATHTTPPPLILQKHLANMKRLGIKYVVMEASSHALCQYRLEGINFNCAIFTNLTRDHLDYHKNLENYKKAKKILFDSLSENSIAILNNDDKSTNFMIKDCKAKIILFGLDNNSPIYPDNLSYTNKNTIFKLITPISNYNLKTNMIGEHNLYNSIASFISLINLKINFNLIIKSLEKIYSPPGRLEIIDKGQNFTVIVDYAHTDHGLKSVLLTLEKIKKQKIILVFGCGGDRDKGKRILMGKIASKYADFSFITNDNPRKESPEKIALEIIKGFNDKKKYSIILDRKNAIYSAIKMAKKDDIILIAGKGHEDTQIIGEKIISFNDKIVVEELLQL